MSNVQSVRKCLIAFPGGSAPKELESSATTWGELKTEIGNQFDEYFENQKVRDYDNNHHYADDAAVLPTGPLQLLVSTDKNKSGMPISKANYHKAPFGDLRTFCKKITGFAPNGKQELIASLDRHYGKTSPKVEDKPKSKLKSSKSPAATRAKGSSEVSALKARVKELEAKVEELEGEDGFVRAARQLE